MRNTLHLPVPEVYAWSSKASENAVGAEYIIMEKQPGIVLSDVWGEITGKQKARVVQQIAEIEITLASAKFTKYEAIYYKQDLPASDNNIPLYINNTGDEVLSSDFGIGPTNHRSFFDFGKGQLDIDRGPCRILAFP